MRCEPLNTLGNSKEVLSRSEGVGMEYSENLMQGRGLNKRRVVNQEKSKMTQKYVSL